MERRAREQKVTGEMVLNQLRKHDFAVLSTVSEDGMPFSAGVSYGVTGTDKELAIYVMTRRHLRKARNIAANPRISLVVPLARRVLWFLPPATIQLQGTAEILDWTDETGTEVFGRFWMGRRILEAYETSRRRGETRVRFLRITPDPVVHTYMVGSSVWELRKRMESAAATVDLGPKRPLPAGAPQPQLGGDAAKVSR
jgi:general stress protein 26